MSVCVLGEGMGWVHGVKQEGTKLSCAAPAKPVDWSLSFAHSCEHMLHAPSVCVYVTKVD